MATDPLLVLGRYLLIVAVAGAVLDRLLVGRDLNAPLALVHPSCLPGNKARSLESEETHLHAQVFRLIVLVQEQFVYLADLLSVAVVDLVPRVALEDLLRRLCPALERLVKSPVDVQDGARSQATIQGPKQETATRTLCSSLIG